MANIEYKLTHSRTSVAERRDIVIYGVECILNGYVKYRFSDVLDDKAAMSEFVDLCNSLRLDPCHLQDAIEDLLADGALLLPEKMDLDY